MWLSLPEGTRRGGRRAPCFSERVSLVRPLAEREQRLPRVAVPRADLPGSLPRSLGRPAASPRSAGGPLRVPPRDWSVPSREDQRDGASKDTTRRAIRESPERHRPRLRALRGHHRGPEVDWPTSTTAFTPRPGYSQPKGGSAPPARADTGSPPTRVSRRHWPFAARSPSSVCPSATPPTGRNSSTLYLTRPARCDDPLDPSCHPRLRDAPLHFRPPRARPLSTGARPA